MAFHTSFSACVCRLKPVFIAALFTASPSAAILCNIFICNIFSLYDYCIQNNVAILWSFQISIYIYWYLFMVLKTLFWQIVHSDTYLVSKKTHISTLPYIQLYNIQIIYCHRSWMVNQRRADKVHMWRFALLYVCFYVCLYEYVGAIWPKSATLLLLVTKPEHKLVVIVLQFALSILHICIIGSRWLVTGDLVQLSWHLLKIWSVRIKHKDVCVWTELDCASCFFPHW